MACHSRVGEQNAVNESAFMHGAQIGFCLFVPAREVGDNFCGPAELRGIGAFDRFRRGRFSHHGDAREAEPLARQKISDKADDRSPGKDIENGKAPGREHDKARGEIFALEENCDDDNGDAC